METNSKKRYGTSVVSVYSSDPINFPFITKEEALETNPHFIVEIEITKGKVKKELYPVACDIEIMSRERVDAYTRRGKDVENNKLIRDLKDETTWIKMACGSRGLKYPLYVPFNTVGGKVNFRYYAGIPK